MPPTLMSLVCCFAAFATGGLFPTTAAAQPDKTQSENGPSNRELERRINDLERRVKHLEAENYSLKGTLSVLQFIDDARAGENVQIEIDGQIVATLFVSNRDWGNSRPVDVAAVVKSVASIIFSTVTPSQPIEVMIVRSKYGPRALTHRGPQGEYIVFLNTGDRLWAQLAYQLAHELGHVLCNELTEYAPQHWFEEAFCEAMSLWTLAQMARVWQTDAPYPSWTSYAKSLADYHDEIVESIDHPDDLANWYSTHRDLLDNQPYDREKNRIIAFQIAQQAKTKPDILRVFLYLRCRGPETNTIESLFAVWLEECPDG